MRQLLLLRHAKTERSNPGGDHARRLVARGHEDAARIAGHIARDALVPGFALVSDAVRTRETFVDLCNAWGREIPARFEQRLYLAEAGTMLEEIWSVEGEGPLIVVGHNPGIHELACALAGSGERALVSKLIGNFPTAALAVLQFEVTGWDGIMQGEGRLTGMMTAKELRPA